MLFHPISQATRCFLSGEVIIYWRGVGTPGVQDYPPCILRSGPAQTDVSGADRCPTWARLPPIGECRLRRGTHGGAKVAGDPGEEGRWARVGQVGELHFSLDAAQHCQVREWSIGLFVSWRLHVWPHFVLFSQCSPLLMSSTYHLQSVDEFIIKFRKKMSGSSFDFFFFLSLWSKRF